MLSLMDKIFEIISSEYSDISIVINTIQQEMR